MKEKGNFHFESKLQEEIYKKAEEIAQKLKEHGWIDAPDNPYNEMIYHKKCSVCGNEIVHRLTKTASLSEKQLEKIINDTHKPEKCLACRERELKK